MHDAQQLWQAVLGELELNLSKANFTTWFKNTSISRIENETVVIRVPNTFSQTWIEKKFHDYILKTLKTRTNNDIKTLTYEVELKKQVTPHENKDVHYYEAPPQRPQLSNVFGINPKYNFDAYIVGKSNELAHAACHAVSRKPGKSYNPLFIWGGVGLGKTHLVQAIGNVLLSVNPNVRILYASCEKFTNDYIDAVRNGRAKSFQDKYRNVDLLIIDDIQFITGKEGTQEAFFHTFNALHQNDKQIIITSDRPPKAIATLEQRLLSRFEWGMIAEIQQPDYETRIAILQQKCNEKSFNLEQEIIEFIATEIQQNVRELEGALNTIIAHYELKQIELTVESIKRILSTISSSAPQKNISHKEIIDIVSRHFSQPIDALMGSSRKKEIVLPRQILMYLLRIEMEFSFPQIGQEIGGRDHTTVMHACDKIERELEYNDRVKRDLQMLKQKIYA